MPLKSGVPRSSCSSPLIAEGRKVPQVFCSRFVERLTVSSIPSS